MLMNMIYFVGECGHVLRAAECEMASPIITHYIMHYIMHCTNHYTLHYALHYKYHPLYHPLFIVQQHYEVRADVIEQNIDLVIHDFCQ
jgi:hypothetical protein